MNKMKPRNAFFMKFHLLFIKKVKNMYKNFPVQAHSWDPIILFSTTFGPKSACVRGQDIQGYTAKKLTKVYFPVQQQVTVKYNS